MALPGQRKASVPTLAGVGAGIVPPQSVIRPDYKIVLDIDGGLNTNRPPDQLDDSESQDMQNLVYVNKVLCVDFGVKLLGSRVYGIPQQPIEFIQPATGAKFELVVTTRTLYSYDSAVGTNGDWVPIPSNATSPATVNGNQTLPTSGTTVSIPFTGSATWTTGQLVGIQMNNGLYLVGVTGGTTSPVSITSAIWPGGTTIANGASIYPLPTFTSDGSLPISWCFSPPQGWVIFCNGFDLPQAFDGDVCKPVTNVSGVVSTARYCARYHGITILGYTTESGVVYPYRIRRSATNDPTNWTTLDAGNDDLVDSGDAITGIINVNPYLAICREDSIVRASYYGLGLQVLWYDYGLSNTGTLSNAAVSATRTAALLVCEPGVFIYNGDYGLTDIGDKIFNSFLSYSGELNCKITYNMFHLYVPILDETWIFYADQTMTWPGKVMRYRHKNNAWFKRVWTSPLNFSGAGLFSLWNTALRWVDLGSTRWIDRHRPWNARANQPLYHQLLLCNPDTATYAFPTGFLYLYDWNTTVSDNGTPISWYFTSKDYPLPDQWKTLDGIVFYGKGIVDIVEISTDGGQTYHQLNAEIGQINLGTFWSRFSLDCSLTCNFVRIRFSGVDPSFKLSWFAFKTMYASEQ